MLDTPPVVDTEPSEWWGQYDDAGVPAVAASYSALLTVTTWNPATVLSFLFGSSTPLMRCRGCFSFWNSGVPCTAEEWDGK